MCTLQKTIVIKNVRVAAKIMVDRVTVLALNELSGIRIRYPAKISGNYPVSGKSLSGTSLHETMLSLIKAMSVNDIISA